jgi:hypothetical protein
MSAMLKLITTFVLLALPNAVVFATLRGNQGHTDQSHDQGLVAVHLPIENPKNHDDPVTFFENLLPPRLRRLGVHPQNPLQCMGDTLVAGDKLVIGQAVCFDGYEFGLADNGKVTFFDHWNYHPEVVIWQEPTAKGSYLYLDPNGGGLVLHNDQDEAVWQVGTTTTSGNSAVNVLEVTENGTVVLSSHDKGDQKIHWSMSLDGAITVA